MPKESKRDLSKARYLEARQQADAAAAAYNRLATSGHAGGLIATLGFLGSSLRAAEPAGLTWFFWVAVVFGVGLILNGLVRLLQIDIATSRRRIEEIDFHHEHDDPIPCAAAEKDRLQKRIPKFTRRVDWLNSLSLAILLVGGVVGFWLLYDLVAAG